MSYFVGVILILAGVCFLVNKKARTAATSLELTILLTVLWIYLPILLAAPTDVVVLNFFFDTLLFCGAILLLANSIDKETAGDWKTGVRLANCDSLSLATVVLLNDLEASALESQNRKPDPGFSFAVCQIESG